MQSLSTFSRLTAEELVHLHKRGCTAGFGLVPFQIQSILDMIPRSSLCVEIKTGIQKPILRHKLNLWLSHYVIELRLPFSTTVHKLHLHWAQAASQHKDPPNRPFYTCSPWGAEVLNKEPCCQWMHLQRALPIVLASDCANAPSVTYESHKDSYGYIHRLPHHRGRLYCPILRCFR